MRAAENRATLEQKLKAYEAILSKQKFLAGDVRHSSSLTAIRVINTLAFLQIGDHSCGPFAPRIWHDHHRAGRFHRSNVGKTSKCCSLVGRCQWPRLVEGGHC